MNMNIIKPPRLREGGTIGIIAPSLGTKPEYIERSCEKLRALGFGVKFGRYAFSLTNGYAGSVEERTADFNEMIADDEVNALLFGGGEVCNEIIPYIDYESIRRHPKIICSYSDSTTVLNAVHTKTGLVTFYGASVRTFDSLTDYNLKSFRLRLMSSDTAYVKNSEWRTIRGGSCSGILTGGYLINFAAMLGGEYLCLGDEKRLLFIEDHEKFSSPAVVSKWFSHMEERGAFRNAAGLIFGHYSMEESPQIDEILARIGERLRIPVVRCEDFGHGVNSAVFPLGISAYLDTESGKFGFAEAGVQ